MLVKTQLHAMKCLDCEVMKRKVLLLQQEKDSMVFQATSQVFKSPGMNISLQEIEEMSIRKMWKKGGG